MKANELRIGNYFQWSDLASMGKGIDIITHGQQISDYIDFKEPIPITEEWLLKFGFESNYPVVSREYTSESITDLKLIDHYEHGFLFIMIWWKTGTFIKYVHQLQNLYFALTGTELTFKIKTICNLQQK